MKLVKDKTGKEVKVGEKLLDDRGIEATVIDWRDPVPGELGWVIVDYRGRGPYSGAPGFDKRYPSIFNTHFEK